VQFANHPEVPFQNLKELRNFAAIEILLWPKEGIWPRQKFAHELHRRRFVALVPSNKLGSGYLKLGFHMAAFQ
jgi:hypothetical protein